MRKKLMIIIAAIVVLGGGLIYHISNRGVDPNTSTQSKPTYGINLMSGKSYMVAKPTMLHYNIQDQDGKVLKDFDVVHEKKMHLIVVRTDRTNFQHVHPTLDEANGTFMIEPFTFPSDGDYRVFADFTPSNAQKDEMGMKLPVTPYQDVQVGDVSKYQPEVIEAEDFESQANGFNINFFPAPHDPSDPGLVAGTGNSLAFSVYKNGQPYTGLEPYLGAKGHLVLLAPDLEFIHGHPQADSGSQSFVITFNADFPKVGLYKAYLQTQAEGKVNTTDYTLSVKPMPSNSQDNQSMPGMDHSGQ